MSTTIITVAAIGLGIYKLSVLLGITMIAIKGAKSNNSASDRIREQNIRLYGKDLI